MLAPASAALVMHEFPPHRRSTAIAAWAAAGSVATLIGPTLGAFLVDGWGWQWAFWLNVPFGVLGLVLIPMIVKEMPRAQVVVPDLWSIPLIMASVSGLVLGISRSSAWGWGSARTIGSICSGLVLGLLVVWRSKTTTRPLLDLDLFRYRSFGIANISSVVYGSTFFVIFFGLPRFTQEVWHYPIRQAGLLFLPIAVCGAFLNPYAGRLTDRYGPRLSMVLGGLIQAVGGGVLWLAVGTERNLVVWFVGMGLIGIGSGFTWPAVFGSTVIGVPPSDYAAVTSINQTSQRIGTAFGSALSALLIGEAVQSQVGTFWRIFACALVSGLAATVIGLNMAGRRSKT